MAVYRTMSNEDILNGGNAVYRGPGNAIVEARVIFAVAFAADWRIRAQGFGFDGRLEVRHRGESILAVDPEKAGSVIIETAISLTPGTYTVLVYGVFDGASESRARSGISPKPSILFKEPKFCNMTEWTAIKPGALTCVVPTLLDEKPDTVQVVVKPEVKLPAIDFVENEKTGEVTSKDP